MMKATLEMMIGSVMFLGALQHWEWNCLFFALVIIGFVLFMAAVEHRDQGLLVWVLGLLGAGAFLSGIAEAFIWLGNRLGKSLQRSP